MDYWHYLFQPDVSEFQLDQLRGNALFVSPIFSETFPFSPIIKLLKMLLINVNKRYFSLYYSVHTDTEAHSTSYPMDVWRDLSGGGSQALPISIAKAKNGEPIPPLLHTSNCSV
jgi:hypothetical protein